MNSIEERAKALGEMLMMARGDRTIVDIAEKTKGEIRDSYLRRVERGLNNQNQPFIPKPDTLRLIAKVYGVEYLDLAFASGIITVDDLQRKNKKKVEKIVDPLDDVEIAIDEMDLSDTVVKYIRLVLSKSGIMLKVDEISTYQLTFQTLIRSIIDTKKKSGVDVETILSVPEETA